jgi:hypothetical protein
VELAVQPPAPKEVNIDSLSYYKNHPQYCRCGVLTQVCPRTTFEEGGSVEEREQAGSDLYQWKRGQSAGGSGS